MGYIYLITNKINDKKYVGQTRVSIQSRWRTHVAVSKRCKGYIINEAIRKYGESSFQVVELDRADSIDRLNELEVFYISTLNTIRPNGYNLDSGGNNFKRHPQTGAKISAAKKGKKHGPYPPRSAEHSHNLSLALKGKPSWWKGKKRSAESRVRMSMARKGKPGHPHTDEFKARLSKRNIGNSYGVGRTFSDETKERLSRNAIRRPRSSNGTFTSQ